MAASEEYLAYVVEQLEGAGSILPKRMFGGFGLYADGIFFAIIGNDTLYFKVDDSNRKDYESAGMEPFKPFDSQTHCHAILRSAS